MGSAAGGKVVVDMDRCTGQGRCFSQYTDVFDCDDDGYAKVLVQVVDAGSQLAEDAQDAVLSCPESAIRVES